MMISRMSQLTSKSPRNSRGQGKFFRRHVESMGAFTARPREENVATAELSQDS